MFIFLAKISCGINVHKTKTRTSPEGPSSPGGPLSPTGPEQLKDSPLSPENNHQNQILMFKFESFLSWVYDPFLPLGPICPWLPGAPSCPEHPWSP